MSQQSTLKIQKEVKEMENENSAKILSLTINEYATLVVLATNKIEVVGEAYSIIYATDLWKKTIDLVEEKFSRGFIYQLLDKLEYLGLILIINSSSNKNRKRRRFRIIALNMELINEAVIDILK